MLLGAQQAGFDGIVFWTSIAEQFGNAPKVIWFAALKNDPNITRAQVDPLWRFHTDLVTGKSKAISPEES
jgi:hypothetical protein